MLSRVRVMVLVGVDGSKARRRLSRARRVSASPAAAFGAP